MKFPATMLRRAALPAFVILALLTVSAPAINGTWTSTAGGSWTNTANWSGGVIADGSDSLADFSTLNLAANATVTLDEARTNGTLVFADATTASHDWLLNTGVGGVLTLQVGSGVPVISVVNRTVNLGVVLAGTQGFYKTGAGTLNLTNFNNSFSGDVAVGGGTLQLGTLTANQTYTFPGAGLSLTNATLYFAGSSGGTATHTYNFPNLTGPVRATNSVLDLRSSNTTTKQINAAFEFIGNNTISYTSGNYTHNLNFNRAVTGSGTLTFNWSGTATGRGVNINDTLDGNNFTGSVVLNAAPASGGNNPSLVLNKALGAVSYEVRNRWILRNNVVGGLDSANSVNLASASATLTLSQAWSNTNATLVAVSGAYINLGTNGNSVVGKLAVNGVAVPVGVYTEADLLGYGLNSGLTGTATLEVKQLYANSAPYFTSNPILKPAATEDVAYSGSLAADAADPDAGDTLTFSKISGPAWLTVGATGAISGTPANGDVGTNSWTVRVTDSGSLSADAILTIVVANVNDAPTFTVNPIVLPSLNPGESANGSLYYYSADVDAGDIRTFAKLSGPAWLNVAANGNVTGSPGVGDAGTNSWTVKVQDAAGATNTATLQITVGSISGITSVANGVWTNSAIWSDSLAPTSDKNYVVDGETVESPLLTVSGSQNFTGNRLTVASGVLRLRLEHTGASETANYSLPGLTIAGGTLRPNATTGNSTWVINGPVAFSGTSAVELRGGSYTTELQLAQGISGSGTINFSTDRSGTAGTGERAHLRVSGTDNPMTGDWTVTSLDSTGEHANLWAAGPNSLGTGTVTLNANGRLIAQATGGLNSLAGITLNFSSSALVLSNPYVKSNGYLSVVSAATVELGNGNSVVGSFGLNGAPVAAGTYTESDLSTLGLTVPFTGSGSLVVLGAFNQPVFTTGALSVGDIAEDAFFTTNIAGLVTDTDGGDAIKFSKISGPAWLSVSTNGVLSGAPLQTNVGPNSLVVRATDTHGLWAELTVDINVTNVNDAPVFLANPIIGGKSTDYSAISGNIAGSATDEDLVVGDVLSFGKLAGPTWLTVNPDGSLTGTPAPANNGSNVFTVVVTDLAGASNTTSMIVWVGPTTTTVTSVSNGVWTAGTTWSDGLAPFTFYAYAVDGETVSAPDASGALGFAGDSVAVTSGTLRLPREHGTTTQTVDYSITNLALAGGSLQFDASIGSVNWNLNTPLAVAAPSTIRQTDGSYTFNMNLNAALSGTGSLDFIVDRSDTGNAGSFLNLSGNNTNFSGNWTVTSLDAGGGAQLVSKAVGALGTGKILLNAGGRVVNDTWQGLDSVSGINAFATNAQVLLNNPWENTNAFLSVNTSALLDLGFNPSTVGAFATNGAPVAAGSYYAWDLAALGVNAINSGPLIVLGAFNQPSFTSNPTLLPDGATNVAYAATLAGKATDADAGDVLSYAKVSGPAWLSVAANGVLSGTPGSADLGTNTFTLLVSDTHGLYATGSAEIVVTPGVTVNTTLTNLVSSVSGGNLTLSWPADHIGWRLETQTNSRSVGLNTNWFTVPDSHLTNSVTIPVNPANPTVFYRLAYP